MLRLRVIGFAIVAIQAFGSTAFGQRPVWTPPSENAPASPPGVPLDPAKLPDVMEVHMGMKAGDARAVIQKAYPGVLVFGWRQDPRPYNNLTSQQNNYQDFLAAEVSKPRTTSASIG